MSKHVMISFLGENKPNLISDVTNYLTEQGGEFSGVTFATLGRVCELTMVYEVSGYYYFRAYSPGSVGGLGEKERDLGQILGFYTYV